MSLGRAKYATCCNQVNRLFDDCNLESTRMFYPNYPADLPSVMRKLKYREQWEVCRNEGWYDYALGDGAIFQFRYRTDNFSFCFMQNPFDLMSFEQFAFDRYNEDLTLPGVDFLQDHEIELREEYERYQSSEMAERAVTPIRYDYEPEFYREGRHPVGHIHIGISNQLRIAARKVLNPLSFAMFVVRQNYPNNWEAFTRHHEFSVRSREIRENLDDVASLKFKGLDHCEMYLI